MRNSLGGKFSVKSICFLSIIAHAHYLLPFNVGGHGIHDEFSGRAPGKITYIICFEDPGLLLSALIFFGGLCFIQGYNFNRLFRRLCFLQARKLCRSQNLLIVLAFTGCTNHMISGSSHLHFEIPERQRKFTPASELMVLPSLEIAVYTKTRIPLRHSEEVITIFREIFISATTTIFKTVGDLIIPIEIKSKFLSGLQGCWQFHPHHGFVDGVFERFTQGIRNLEYIKTIPI